MKIRFGTSVALCGALLCLCLGGGCKRAAGAGAGRDAGGAEVARSESALTLADEFEEIDPRFVKWIRELGCREGTCTSTKLSVWPAHIPLDRFNQTLRGLRTVSFFNKACKSEVEDLLVERPTWVGGNSSTSAIPEIQILEEAGWFTWARTVVIVCFESCTSPLSCGKAMGQKQTDWGRLAEYRCQKMYDYLDTLRTRVKKSVQLPFELPRIQVACDDNTRSGNPSWNAEMQRTVLLFTRLSLPPLAPPDLR